jgi:hypothetical protein
MYIDYFVEKSPSSRSHCQKCKRAIPMKSSRLVKEDSYFGSPANKFWCGSCGRKMLTFKIKEYDNLIRKLK